MGSCHWYAIPVIELFKAALKKFSIFTFENMMLRKPFFNVIKQEFSKILSTDGKADMF